MNDALLQLKNQICSLDPINTVSDADYQKFTSNCVVVLMSGGESSRFREVEQSGNSNKNAFKLPNGDTMIEMTIRMYRDAGFKSFVVLAYHKAKSIEAILGDGSALGVNIQFSYDPGPVGKGGAVRNAIENGSIPSGSYFIVHNPDDAIINYKGSFARDIVSGHMQAEKEGCVSTVVVVEETPYSYTGMKISHNKVSQIELYPMIPIPTHVGVTLFSPAVTDYFYKNFDYNKKSEFEKVLFPILSNEKKLYAVSIPEGCWIAVNNYKSYKKLLETLDIK